jgi:enamine deaminase RidA (YjgF/YER057c/UK114 family)
MTRKLISSGSKFETEMGYSRAVVDGDWIFVSGTTGFDYGNMTIQDDAVAQCEQALKNIAAALKQADSSFADVVRVHYLMTDAADFERCWPAMGKAFGEVRPAATMMVVGLADPRMRIEIEVTALRRKAAPRKKKAKSPARRKK